MMRSNIKYLIIIGTLLLSGCAASEPETVSFDIPFSGALTNDTRVVAADGAALSSGNSGLSIKSQQRGSVSFNLFDSAGNNVGTMRMDEVSMSTPTTQGIETFFTMPVSFQLTNGDVAATNSMQFVETAYSDPTIEACNQQGVRCVRGAGSGVINRGTGNFEFAVNRRVIEHRYVAAVTGEGTNRHAVHQVHSVVLLHQ